MSIPFRTRRRLQRIGTAMLIFLLAFVIFWLCWVIWLQRYVVYTDDGAKLNFSQSSYEIMGEVVQEKVHEPKISIFYNEGADAIDTKKDLTQINGYYITNDMIKANYNDIMLQLERLPAGTAIMVEMKGPYGSFFYSSNLADATISASTNISEMDALITKLKNKGFYTIARISAFRDREFGNKKVTPGLYMLSRAGLWMDPGGMFWLDPTNATTTSWISSVVLELKGLGFDEVLLDNFRFPDSNQYIFNGDKDAALQQAAATLVSACASEDFTLSFLTTGAAFPLPDGRTRLYLENVSAAGIGNAVGATTFEEKEIRLVFLSDIGDTRFDEYSVLRSIEVAEEVEARKAG